MNLELSLVYFGYTTVIFILKRSPLLGSLRHRIVNMCSIYFFNMGVHYIVTNLYTLFSMQVGHNVMDSLYVERSINLKRNLQAEKIEHPYF